MGKLITESKMPKLYVFELAEITQSSVSDEYAAGVSIDSYPEPCAVIYGSSHEQCLDKFKSNFDINDYVTSWTN